MWLGSAIKMIRIKMSMTQMSVFVSTIRLLKLIHAYYNIKWLWNIPYTLSCFIPLNIHHYLMENQTYESNSFTHLFSCTHFDEPKPKHTNRWQKYSINLLYRFMSERFSCFWIQLMFRINSIVFIVITTQMKQLV